METIGLPLGEFFAAFAAIVIIDLALAGDNAIVIALAARSVPKPLRRRAVLWGAVGAVAVRSALTAAVMWLLAIPGLLIVGGATLVWIAYKLLLPESESDDGVAPAIAISGFWGAIRTIVVADLAMGLDNVLAVAGAARGSFALVALGLLVSIPIVVWGSTAILRFLDRFPAFIYVGAAVLAWTAARMMTEEPMLKEFYADHRFVVPLLFVAVIGGVLWAGFAKNHRRWESRITTRLARFADRPPIGEAKGHSTRGGSAMPTKVLVPIDGSLNAHHAVQRVVAEFLKNPEIEIHLLNVQPPFSRHVARFAARKNRADFHRAQGEKALLPVRNILERARVPYVVHVEVGDKAQLIAEVAQRLACDHIVMAVARKNSLTRMLEDATLQRVLERTEVPVEIVAGDAVSKWERWGIPAGIGAALMLLLLAAD